jgi:CheY-like chemotaxis protein
MIVHGAAIESAGRVHPSADAMPSTDLRLADLTGISVLLVDDDGDALQMAKDALSFAGARVVTASSADEAIAALDARTFDAAVLDIGMPDVDGYQLLKLIRQRSAERQGKLPVAALTAYARSIDRTRSLQAGFQMHLSKPVQPTELAAAVLALAARRNTSVER